MCKRQSKFSHSCPQGEHEENGLCVKDSPTSCPQGEHLDNGLCVKDSNQHHVLKESI